MAATWVPCARKWECTGLDGGDCISRVSSCWAFAKVIDISPLIPRGRSIARFCETCPAARSFLFFFIAHIYSVAAGTTDENNIML